MGKLIGAVLGRLCTILGYDGTDFRNVLVDASGHLQVDIIDPFTAPDSDMVDAIHASATAEADKLLALDADGKLPGSITGDAATVDGIHASATAEANKLLALDASSKLPASITGDAETVDGYHVNEVVMVNPSCRVYNTTDIAVANAAWQILTFNAERFDTGAMHSLTGNTDRLYFNIAGTYLVGAHVKWYADTTGLRLLRFKLNAGDTFIAEVLFLNPGDIYLNESLVTLWAMTAGDYLVVQAYQNCGHSLIIQAHLCVSPEFWAVRVA